MTLQLPKSADLDQHTGEPNEPSLESFIESWINAQVVDEVLAMNRRYKTEERKPYRGVGSVGMRTPGNMYGNVKNRRFYALLNAMLKPLGYWAEKSHDGGGMYEVTEIKWRYTAEPKMGDAVRARIQGKWLPGVITHIEELSETMSHSLSGRHYRVTDEAGEEFCNLPESSIELT